LSPPSEPPAAPDGDREPPATDDRREPSPPPDARTARNEALATFGAVTALCAGLYWVGMGVPFVKANLGGFFALAFLAVPVWLLDRRREPLARYGITWQPLGRGLLWGLGTAAVVLGLFMVVYVWYFGAVCGDGAELLGPLGRRCDRWCGGLSELRLTLPAGFWKTALAMVVVVAIPEEVFYRGYLMGRLEQAWPARRHLWGAPLGWALLVQAALFGLGHFLVDLNPLRLAVAVPALLFGLLRFWSGSIVAPVIVHVCANLLMSVVDRSFFP
jgi:membrane protease YdiL (CAAX protease family)